MRVNANLIAKTYTNQAICKNSRPLTSSKNHPIRESIRLVSDKLCGLGEFACL